MNSGGTHFQGGHGVDFILATKARCNPLLAMRRCPMIAKTLVSPHGFAKFGNLGT